MCAGKEGKRFQTIETNRTVGSHKQKASPVDVAARRPPYLVIDLSSGMESGAYPVYSLDNVPIGGWTDEYRSAKLVMRLIPAGTFLMGSPEDEPGRNRDERQHQVTLTRDFYLGVFAVTQEQWELVMGENPSGCRGVGYPVERVSYDMIRGWTMGPGWPRSPEVSGRSFLGRIRSRTGIDTFDLPTEAQWEYACRAGTTTAFNNGKDLTNLKKLCPNLDEVGCYELNRAAGTGVHQVVGKYKPNAWGLYDMHGNVSEWCLDRYGDYRGDATDPKGASAGSGRILRGGSWRTGARCCRSAYRGSDGPSDVYGDSGFRLCLTVEQK